LISINYIGDFSDYFQTWPFSFQGGKAGPGSDGKSPEHMKSPLDQDMSPVSDITM